MLEQLSPKALDVVVTPLTVLVMCENQDTVAEIKVFVLIKKGLHQREGTTKAHSSGCGVGASHDE